MENIPYLLALHQINGLGPIRLKALLEFYKDPKLAWEANKKELTQIGIPKNVVEEISQVRRKIDPERIPAELIKKEIKYLTIFDGNYPRLLKQIYDPPIVLYYKGDINDEDRNAIAVVGTRKMTGYGKEVTIQFTKGLVEAGLTIVSGLARGVDTQAHSVAVENGGRTIAVLGGGLNHIYPPENMGLVQKIINGHGAVISEYPPDHPSLPGNFPARNRIISGLSKGALITEAAADSGSLITARLALEQGRDVFAIPGPITSSMSRGAIDLIKEGAKPVAEPSEVLEDLGFKMQNISQSKTSTKVSIEEQKVLEVLNDESLHVDEICRVVNLPAAQVLSALLKMEICGLVRNLGGGVYCRN